MSAIAGVWSFDGGLRSAPAWPDMLQALSIYGPDDARKYQAHR